MHGLCCAGFTSTARPANDAARRPFLSSARRYPEVCPHIHFQSPCHCSGSASSPCSSIVRIFMLCTWLPLVPQPSGPVFGGPCSLQHSGRGHSSTFACHCASHSLHGRVKNTTGLRVKSVGTCAHCYHVHGKAFFSVDLVCALTYSNIYVHISMWVSSVSVQAHLPPCVCFIGFNVVSFGRGCRLFCVLPGYVHGTDDMPPSCFAALDLILVASSSLIRL